MGFIVNAHGYVSEDQTLNAADFNENDVIQVQTISGQKRFVGAQVSSSSGGSGASQTAGLIQYYYFRAIITQSGTTKCSVSVTDDGSYIDQNIAVGNGGSFDGYSASGSSYESVGSYLLQFKTDRTSQFVEQIRENFYGALMMEKKVHPIYSVPDEMLLGYCLIGANRTLGDFDFAVGRIRIMTFDPSWVLSNDILQYGETLEFRLFLRLGI